MDDSKKDTDEMNQKGEPPGAEDIDEISMDEILEKESHKKSEK